MITGLLAFPGDKQLIQIDIWWVAGAIGLAAFLGGEVGYLIGHKAGPRIFERKETGLFSIENVRRTNSFFERFGGLAVILARFVPIVRTFAPVAAGVGHMNYRKYSLYNLIGALIWAAGLTVGGYLLGYIPPVARLRQRIHRHHPARRRRHHPDPHGVPLRAIHGEGAQGQPGGCHGRERREAAPERGLIRPEPRHLIDAESLSTQSAAGLVRSRSRSSDCWAALRTSLS